MAVSTYSRHYGLPSLERRGKVSLGQRLTTVPEPTSDSLLHTLIAGETLDHLAAVYYEREDLWWRIADANPGRFPLDWQPGDVLVIPPIRIATSTPRRYRTGWL